MELSLHRTASVGEALQRLSSPGGDGQRVLSLYLSLDPARFPHMRERHMQADALLAHAERTLEGEEEPSHADRMQLREDIERIREFLSDEELSAPAARGLALFCSVPAGLFEVVALPRSVEGTVAFERRPFVEPLVEVLAPERWCVLLMSRRAERIMRGTREHFVEVAHVLDDVYRHHAQGGWSQARYQRGVEHEVDEHIRSGCRALFEHLQRRPFDRLLIGGPQELRHRVEGELHAELSRRLAGHFEIDVERCDPEEVRHRALPLIEADERGRELEALERLREGLAPGGHAAAGLDEVLQLLNDGRVQTLLLADGYAAAGFECPRCGRLTASDQPCMVDGTSGHARDDIVERAIERAIERSAQVMIVRHEQPAFAEHGPVAALLRY